MGKNISPINAFQEIVAYLSSFSSVQEGYRIEITDQFVPEEQAGPAIARNINAAFLIILSGQEHPKYNEAAAYLKGKGADPAWRTSVRFYSGGLETVAKEFEAFAEADSEVSGRISHLISGIRQCLSCGEIRERLWRLFHPEASGILDNREKREKDLRRQRRVKLTGLNPESIRDVPGEVLFTSNALLTLPARGKKLDELEVSPGVRDALKLIVREPQLYWYDHPVQIGVKPESNEILYGLRHLAGAFAYEKGAGKAEKGTRVRCVLSASVTHEGLQKIVKEYMEGELAKGVDLSGLVVHLFTEADTDRLIHQVLMPAAKHYMNRDRSAAALFKEVVGVDGRYGRHYTFLKALSAFWQVLVDPAVKATFKIDLDQIFPQEHLERETEKTAFEHLMTPLWGARGNDSEDRPVELGMIAGALVNEQDLAGSLFVPDVTYPSGPFQGEDQVFCSRVPQALSTAAEMMTRYSHGAVDGEETCIHRVHVTGGTNGIRIDALRKYRPFTPTFIGRAEDQAYLLSVLLPPGQGPALRYLHEDGLFMRHDKKSFAGDAIKAAAMGKVIGDYERIILFSCYARMLSQDMGEIKAVVDPFTGSFISPIPLTLVYLRLALKAAELFSTGSDEDGRKGLELVESGSARLGSTIGEFAADNGKRLKEIYEREKKTWDLYYNVLDRIEEALGSGDAFALELKKKALNLVNDTEIRLSGRK
jgi:hypothetical protein